MAFLDLEAFTKALCLAIRRKGSHGTVTSGPALPGKWLLPAFRHTEASPCSAGSALAWQRREAPGPRAVGGAWSPKAHLQGPRRQMELPGPLSRGCRSPVPLHASVHSDFSETLLPASPEAEPVKLCAPSGRCHLPRPAWEGAPGSALWLLCFRGAGGQGPWHPLLCGRAVVREQHSPAAFLTEPRAGCMKAAAAGCRGWEVAGGAHRPRWEGGHSPGQQGPCLQRGPPLWTGLPQSVEAWPGVGLTHCASLRKLSFLKMW